jgi:hypothetical protein
MNYLQGHKSRTHTLRDENVQYYSMTAIRRFSRGILVFVAVAILIIPVFILYFVASLIIHLGAIACFSLLFAIAMSLGTKSSNHEIFVALAA